MKEKLCYCLLCIMFVSCTDVEKHKSLDYLPEGSALEKGLVWKYYQTVQKDQEHPRTDIRYKKIKKEGDTLHQSFYDAGFNLNLTEKILLDADDTWKHLSRTIFINRQDTSYDADISKRTKIDWKRMPSESFFKTSNNGYSESLRQSISRFKDTIIDSKPSLLIDSNSESIRVRDEGSDTVRWYTSAVYQKSLGRVYSKSASHQFTVTQELDELISLSEFNRRANHGMHRVGYIDTTKVMDMNSGFTICGSYGNIKDYYNDDVAQFLGGKGRLRKVLSEKLDPTLLVGADGYLSYHFVINCEGQAGWFTTVECGLDYTSTTFSDALKNHLFDILSSEKEWKPLSIDGVPKDAYTYITFKIESGEIIELLP